MRSNSATRILSRACRQQQHSGPSRILIRAESTAATASSTSTPTPFEPALPAGVDPAYDEALAYLDAHNARSRARLDELRAQAAAQSSTSSPNPDLTRRIARLEVDAYVNDPATRRLFRESGGVGHMDRAVIRALAERKWRKEGELDLLMQRIHQLGVVPDVLAGLVPSASVTLTAASGTAPIEPGSFQLPSHLASQPSLHVQLFQHPSVPSPSSPNPEALYTLLVVDPDSPSHETHSFSQRLHYAKTDIPLSVMSGRVDLFAAPGSELVGYEPPAPAKGSGKHRLVFIVVRQGESTPSDLALQRESFDFRQYLVERSLNAHDVVAATLYRSQWSAEEAAHIDTVYSQHRNEPAPVYGRAPKDMRYGYPLSAKAVRAEAIRQEAWDNVLNELEGIVQDGKTPA